MPVGIHVKINYGDGIYNSLQADNAFYVYVTYLQSYP